MNMNMFSKSKRNLLSGLVKLGTLLLLGLTMVFGRSFVGLIFGQYRLGELFIGFGLLVSLIFLLVSKKRIKSFYLSDLQFYSNKLIVLSFFIIALVGSSDLLNTYTYKSSSYIWSIAFLYLGSFLMINKNKEIDYIYFLFPFVPFVTYLFASGNYPNIFIDFFKENSDKFQFLKASDLFLGYAVVNFLNKFIIKSKDIQVFYFLSTSALFLPILLYASRGSFIGVLIFISFEIYYLKKFILENKTKFFIFLLISSLFFVFSLLRVDRTITSETAEPISISQKLTSEYISGSLQQISERRETAKVFLSFYINEDGYLDSWDATTSWRLDIWQDVFYDMVDDDLVLKGYAYNEIFPAMLDPTAPGRIGRDGLNEHIHNYFMNIFARGGIFQFILFAVFHYSIYSYWLKKYNNRQILTLIIPSFFVSALDITMEGVHYPFIYYIFLYLFLKKPIKV